MFVLSEFSFYVSVLSALVMGNVGDNLLVFLVASLVKSVEQKLECTVLLESEMGTEGVKKNISP